MVDGLIAGGPPLAPKRYIFNRPTDVGWDVAGNIFVTDGYGNSRVVKFDKNALTVTFAAAGYVTQTKSLTLNENAELDVVLQRVAPAAPPPAQLTSGGDRIDMRSVIVRGPGGDVANWPVTTQIRVIDGNFGGWFVDFDAKSRSPEAVPAGWDGGIQYTLWIVEKINGQWFTAGGVEYWRGLARQGGPPSRLAGNWYAAPRSGANCPATSPRWASRLACS